MSRIVSAIVLVGLVVAPSLARGQVACEDIVTEKVTLEGDLDCSGDGLIVGADKVTIDLNGFMIEGQGSGSGIKILGFDKVTVKDGTIAGFSECVNVGSDAQKTKLTDLVVFGCTGDGVDLNDSDLAKVKGVFANGNGQNGFTIGFDGTGNKIEKSAAIGNGTAGVGVSGDGNTIKKVDTAVNTDGIRLSGLNNVVDGCTAHRNADHGVNVTNDGNVVKKTAAIGNLDQGILLSGASGVTVEKCEAHGNRQYGILVEDGSDAATLKKNETHGNELNGIRVEGDCDDAVIDGNEAFSNHTDGIRTDSDSSVVKKNEGQLNGQRGIQASSAVDGGGNKASQNADSPQCEGVFCKE